MSLTVSDVVVWWRQYNELGLNVPNHGKSGYLEYRQQVLLSYNVPIACYHPPRFFSNKNGFVLFLSTHINTPWGTLARHKWTAGNVVTWQKFYVPELGIRANMVSPSRLAEDHKLNIQWMLWSIDHVALEAVKHFRVGMEGEAYPDRWGSMVSFDRYVRSKYAEIDDYMGTTGAEFDLPSPEDVIKRVREQREERWVKWSDPKAVVRRERATARRAAIKALGLGD